MTDIVFFQVLVKQAVNGLGPCLSHSPPVDPWSIMLEGMKKCDTIKQLFFFKPHFCPIRMSLTYAAVALEGNLTRQNESQ